MPPERELFFLYCDMECLGETGREMGFTPEVGRDFRESWEKP